MSQFAHPASGRLERSLEVPLTWGERTRIAVQLGSAMLAAGLLAVGLAQRKWGPAEFQEVAELIIALAACVVALPIFATALRGLVVGSAHTFADQLVALAALAAMATGDFVTATLIPVIMSLGHFLEERSILGAQAAIEGLRNLHPAKANLITPAGEREVDPQSLRTGDLLLVRPGDAFPADGRIVQGRSAVDQSSITGESVPEEVGQDSPVYAGSINLSGLLRVEITRTGAQTTLGRVVELLRHAEHSKTPVLKLIEQYAGYYLPIILTVAGAVLFVSRDMSRAIAVLVVGCPGALVLAGPTAMVAALAAASRLGILIKSTRFLESLSDVGAVVLDKTGTVTLGRLEIVSLRPTKGHTEEKLLREALRCAPGSRHPVSQAIVRAAAARGMECDSPLGQVEEHAGSGLRAVGDDAVRLLGRREWLAESGFDVHENPSHRGPIVWMGRADHRGGERAVLGCLLLADRARPEARQAIADLRRLGVSQSILLTGDRREVAEEIGQLLEIDRIVAEVLPEQKLETVREVRASGQLVMVVGDGVNDALALASSDVGVALGAAASDVALRSADVALLADDLGRLPIAVRLARRTRTTIHQNVLLGAGVSILFVWLASVGFISPLAGAVLHNVGATMVILNSARLLAFTGNVPARPATKRDAGRTGNRTDS